MSIVMTKLHEVMGNIRAKYDAFDNTGTDTLYLTSLNNPVFIDTDLGVGTVYLPPVAEAAAVGIPITIIRTGSGVNASTIKDFGDARVAINKTDMNAAGDSATYHATGETWHLINDGVV